MMKQLTTEVEKIKETPVREIIKKRLQEFKTFTDKDTKAWFSELCFCILTANSKAETAIKIQKELGTKGFYSYSRKRIRDCIYKNKHRFHNNKAKYICESRMFKDRIDKIVKTKEGHDAREWLVTHVKGMGYKEASHFLRNVGYTNLAIIDRHVLDIMHRYKLIKDKPKTVTKKLYLDIERKFLAVAKKLDMSAAELDMYIWYMKTEKVLK